jgi:hypothetical protein
MSGYVTGGADRAVLGAGQRFGAGEFAGGTGVVGLDGPEVVEGADGCVRGHRGERCGVGYVGSLRTGRPADRGGLEPDARTAALWTESGR